MYLNKVSDHFYGVKVKTGGDLDDGCKVMAHSQAMVGSPSFILVMTGESHAVYIGHEKDVSTKHPNDVKFDKADMHFSHKLELMAASHTASFFLVKSDDNNNDEDDDDSSIEENDMTRTNQSSALAQAQGN